MGGATLAQRRSASVSGRVSGRVWDHAGGVSTCSGVSLSAALLYELLYTQVFGVEGAELCQAMEAFRAGGRRYRNSPSVCSDVDAGYDAPEERAHR